MVVSSRNSSRSSLILAGLSLALAAMAASRSPAALVYGGDRTFEQFEVKVYSWQVL